MTLTTPQQRPELFSVIQSERFSFWNRIVKIMEYVLLFIFRRSAKASAIFETAKIQLRTRAEVILFRITQLENAASPDLCSQLGMFKCQQSNRIRTGITNSALPEETINPIFLIRENFITALFIQHVHQKTITAEQNRP